MSGESTLIDIDAVAKILGLPTKFIPTNVVTFLSAEGPTPTEYNVLTGKEPFSEKKWKYELAHLISELVASKEKEHPLYPTKKVHDVVQNLLQRIASASSHEQVHLALLGLLMLVYDHLEAAKVENLRRIISDDVIEKYPLDVFLQAAGNKLLELEEDLEVLEKPAGPPFQYPPFQKALPYFPSYGYQVTLVFKDDQLDKNIQKNLEVLITILKEKCDKIDSSYTSNGDKREAHSGFNVGFELNFWCRWCQLLDRKPSVPVEEARKMMNCEEENFMKQHLKLKYTEGDMWIFLKATTKEDSEAMLTIVKDYVAQHLPEAKPLVTTSYKKNDGRIFGGQFMDGISNAVDAISMIREVLIPPLPVHDGQISPEGGTFAFIQFFQFDKTALSDVSQPVSENMIGRDSLCSEVLARPNDRCHIKRARIISPKDGSNTEIIRQSLPYVAPLSSTQESENADRGPMSDGLFFVAFGQSAQRFSDILNNILGKPKSAFTDDLLITNVQGLFGKLFYCPSTDELQVLPKFTEDDQYPPIPFWTKYISKNEAYFYNHIQYLYAMSTGYKYGDAPSKRILYLMSKTFARWHSTWVHKFDVPRLPHLREFLSESDKHIMDEPIQVRKGYSYKVMLGEVFTSHKPYPRDGGKVYAYSENFDTYRIDPKELIVGVTDRLSFGSGKEVMPYLKDGDERTLSFNLGLAEDGNMGHIVPGHNYILELGIAGMLQKLRTKLEQKDYKTPDQMTFYHSAIHAYEGVQLYLLKYAWLARKTAKKMHNRTSEANDRMNLREVANRMIRLAYGRTSDFSFHDAVQMIFSMHCCLHLCGQPVSVGRLDQLLIAYYKRDLENGTLTREKAQEIIDAFFIKFDEQVVLNRYNIPYGHTSYGSTAVTGRGGPFPTGDSLNQWIQQITVGGCNEKGEDACNDITLMCLKACRRLPLNAPCISLRLTKSTPLKVKQAAVDALLSGGAHPILYHDEKMIAGLYDVLHQSFVRSNLPVPADLKQVARDYSCDGCYEPMFTGQTEFKFAYIFLLKAVIFTLNSGADYLPADPLYLAGGVSSYKTAPPNDIKTFEQFQDIFLEHLKVMVRQLYGTILHSYGNPWLICPSPLLSCLLEGCIDSGKDMTNGGSRFHILTPMYTGFANTVNSLYNVKKMIFNDSDIATMEMLRMALINNWGENMVEPFYDMTGEGTIHTKMWAQRFKDLRDYALSLPKFGTDTADDEINSLAKWLATEMDSIAYNCLYEKGPIFNKYEELRKKHSTPENPFLFQVMTGSGTFESYVSVGASCAATPDGRLKGQPTASDCSQQPYPQDRPVPPDATPLDIVNSLKPYHTLQLHKYIPNGCEVDIIIPEDFPPEALLEFIEAFINDETGSNLVTVTCVNPETLKRARVEPQKFDLVRNRMGGWSNFFVAMFNKHQLQHMRRPIFGKHEKQ